MGFLNEYIERLKPYQVASHKIWEVDKAEREGMLKLDWNEGSIPPSPRVKEEILKLVADETIYGLYPPTYSDRLMRLLGEFTGVKEENLQYFGSSDSLQEYVSRAILTVGEGVLMVGPTYDNFRLSAEAQGAKLHYFEMDAPFVLDVAALDAKIGEIAGLKMVYLCNPNNPTGTVTAKQELLRLMDQHPEVLFFIDEAYHEFGGETVCEEVMKRENLLVSRTFSKAFCLAGFRIGYLMGSAALIGGISKIRNAKNITVFGQAAACAALEDVAYMREFVKEVTQARKQFVSFLKGYPDKLEVFASEANFVLMRFKQDGEKELMMAHLIEAGIFVRNLTHSEKLKGCLRISVGTTEQMAVVEAAMQDFWG